MAFSPDGHWLATGGVDASIRIWDIGSASTVGGVDALNVAPGGLMVGSGGSARREMTPSTTMAGGAGRLRSLAYSPDGRRLAAGSDDGIIKVRHILSRIPTNRYSGGAPAVI